MRKYLCRKTRLPQRFQIDYSQRTYFKSAFSVLGKLLYFRRILRIAAFSARSREMTCTIFGQAPVDVLHSIDSKQDKVAQFFLTPVMAGVCSQSFFDSY